MPRTCGRGHWSAVRYTLAPFGMPFGTGLFIAYPGGMMPEILTESFCERCGTRYTFESAAPTKAKKLGRFKTLSKGLKNYVLSDDTSMDEAMAAARSDEERELTAQQLDAFHATFNFCMSCRQYTCGNCWNDIEGRCLTCAPRFGQEILPTPFPTFATDFTTLAAAPAPEPEPEPERVEEAWPTADLPIAASAGDTNGHLEVEDVEEVEEIDLASRLGQVGFETPSQPAPAPAEQPDVAAIAETAPAAEAPVAEPAVAEIAAAEPAPAEPVAAEPPPPLPTDVDGRAAAAAARTAALLGRFRPGQSIDAELAAYEASHAADEIAESEAEPAVAEIVAEPGTTTVEPVASEPEPVAVEPEPEPAPVAAEPEPVAAQPEYEPEPVQAQPEPVAAEPEPEPVYVEPEPVAAAEPVAPAAPEPAAQPAPVAAESAPPAPRKDRVEQPTWRIVAPDTPTTIGPDQVDPGLAAAASATPAPSAEPSWPATPQWPTAAPAPGYMIDRLADRSTAALWAASARDVVSPPAGAAPTGIQPCSNCGLSLSATARFCRRCGSPQGA
jgi:hypothetical protein